MLLAIIAGGFLGLERENKGHPAGLRTYMMVCLGAATTMLLSQYLYGMLATRWLETSLEVGIKTDVARFGAQVINGIGFLGAGTILVTNRQEVKGLTTAAGLWASACMGIAIGAGFYECAILGFALLGAALISIGMFMSSLTESQVIAAVAAFGVLLAMYLMNALATLIPSGAMASLISFAVVVLIFAFIVYTLTKNWTVAGITAAVGAFLLIAIYLINASVFDGLFPAVLNWLSVFERFGNFTNGLFDLTSVVYYVSMMALFVFATIQSVEKRRWS